ncbi:U5 snRNP GTPase [Saccharomycopsis crataegensis]|uniref:U5 snRNP GTPase n=1 Tax=Saccharomycopsis crataegensis TaxID=43959 RepID=A0AAV5QQS2_9ASCO|nr:U5 snRNP GTPase [Saccharomycopsis crataegensis]
MDESLYDEFGNYIGDANDSDAEIESNSSDEDVSNSENEISEDEKEQEKESTSKAIVLHEDKQYHPSISQVFSPDVEVTIQHTDTQSLNVPLVKPTINKKIIVEEKNLPEVNYSRDFMANLALKTPEKIRNITFVGNMHSGKTTLLDMLILQTHPRLIEKNKHLQTKNFRSLRYSDNHKLEIERGLSIKASAATFVVPDIKGNSVILNIIDSPGHVNFTDELVAAQDLADGSILVIDIVEGLTIMDKLAIKNAIDKNLALSVVLNKIDRLILELKLPVLDAYYKIKYVIEEINHYIKRELSEITPNYSYSTIFSPELNNIAFASGKLQFAFNLKSFAKKYVELNKLEGHIDIEKFGKRLWGDSVCFNPETGKFFRKTARQLSQKNSFVQFILEPLYKLFSLSISKDQDELADILYKRFHISLHKNLYKQDSQVVLTEVCKQFFGENYGFVDMIQSSLPSPTLTGGHQVQRMKISPAKLKISKMVQALIECSPDGILIANTCKLINTNEADKFYGLTRVYSGSLKVGQKVKILGEEYSSDENSDDFVEFEVKELFIPVARYKFSVNEVGAGSICLIGGDISQVVIKNATICGNDFDNTDEPLYLLQQVNHIFDPIFKVSIKPDHPSHLPELLNALQSISRSYSGAAVKVEESGEYIVSGSGELYLDCILHDIRYLYGDNLEIKVSEPFVQFQETISEKSLVKLTIESVNGKNSIGIICEPLEEDFVKDIQKGHFDNFNQMTKRQVAKTLQEKYNWDSLAARSVWSIGSENGANVLLDDTLSDEVDKKTLNTLKDSIVQGFLWAIKQGPICDETMTNIKFRIISIKLAENLSDRSSGQILPMVRRACYAAYMVSTPRLLEPIYQVDATCTKQSTEAVKKILYKRRGVLSENEPIAATQLYKCIGYLPVLDSVGFETDLRLLTQGQAMCFTRFYEWGVVSGDPLDKDAFIPKLKPASPNFLARDLVTKTRRRKGLGGEPSLEKYIDQSTFQKLKRQGIIE